MLLKADERRKFAEYCRQQADTCRKMAEQLLKLPHGPTEAMAKRERIKAAAFEVIAMDLESVEEYTVTDHTEPSTDKGET